MSRPRVGMWIADDRCGWSRGICSRVITGRAGYGVGMHGTHYDIEPEYDEAVRTRPVVTWEGRSYPSLAEDEHVCDVILNFATVTNGELAYRSYKNMEEKVGLPLRTWPRSSEACGPASRKSSPVPAASSTVRCGRA